MAFRRLLVIHETQEIRDTIRRFLLAEMPDIDFEEAADEADALAKLKTRKYDIVLCAHLAGGLNGRKLSATMRQSEPNAKAHFIHLITKGESKALEKLVRSSFESYIHIPFSPQQLAEKVDEVCDPRAMRSHDRLHVPGGKAIIHMPGAEIEAEIVNLSRTGMLCDFPASEDWSAMWKGAAVSLVFPEAYGGVRLDTVEFTLVRMNIIPPTGDGVLPRVRAAWDLKAITEEDRAALEAVLQKVSQDHTFHIPEGFDFE